MEIKFENLETFFEPSQAVGLKVSLTDGSGRISGADVWCTVMTPQGAVVKLVLKDDGLSDDDQVRDGTYGVKFAGTNDPGFYELLFAARGQTKMGIPFSVAKKTQFYVKKYVGGGIPAVPRVFRVDKDFTGIALLNPFSHSASLSLDRHSPRGDTLQTTVLALASKEQRARLSEEIFKTDPGEWVGIRSQDQILSFTLAGDQDLTYLDGTVSQKIPSKSLIFPEVVDSPKSSFYSFSELDPDSKEQTTEITLINPNAAKATINLTLFGEDGKAISSNTVEVASNGKLTKTAANLIGSKKIENGYLKVESDQPLIGIEYFGHRQSIAATNAINSEQPQKLLYSPQAFLSSEYDSLLNLINTSSTRVQVSTQLYNESGSLSLARTITLAPHEQFNKPLTSIFSFAGGSFVGWLRLESETPSLIGILKFGDKSGKFLTATGLLPAGSNNQYFSHVAQGFGLFTGLALLNPGPDDTSITIDVRNIEGGLKGTTTFTLKGRTKISKLLNELIPSINEQAGGYIHLISSKPIVALELFGRTDLQLLSAVPAQVIQ